MALRTLADHAAATSAGYQRTQTDLGVGKNPRFVSRYERYLTGLNDSGFVMRAEGFSNVDQATADAIALNALIGQRQARYGVDTGATSGNSRSGGSPHTQDVT